MRIFIFNFFWFTAACPWCIHSLFFETTWAEFESLCCHRVADQPELSPGKRQEKLLLRLFCLAIPFTRRKNQKWIETNDKIFLRGTHRWVAHGTAAATASCVLNECSRKLMNQTIWMRIDYWIPSEFSEQKVSRLLKINLFLAETQHSPLPDRWRPWAWMSSAKWHKVSKLLLMMRFINSFVKLILWHIRTADHSKKRVGGHPVAHQWSSINRHSGKNLGTR